MDISLDQASKIVAAALQRATEAGFKPMAVVVLDASGHTKSTQRQDGKRRCAGRTGCRSKRSSR